MEEARPRGRCDERERDDANAQPLQVRLRRVVAPSTHGDVQRHPRLHPACRLDKPEDAIELSAVGGGRVRGVLVTHQAFVELEEEHDRHFESRA